MITVFNRETTLIIKVWHKEKCLDTKKGSKGLELKKLSKAELMRCHKAVLSAYQAIHMVKK